MPSTLTCPITLEPMRLPVVASTGNTFDFTQIAEHLLIKHQQHISRSEANRVKNPDPLSNQSISSLVINRILIDCNGEELSELEQQKIAVYCYELHKKKLGICIETILKHCNIGLFMEQHHQHSLLCKAVDNESIQQVEALLNMQWVNPNRKNSEGNSPLHTHLTHGFINKPCFLTPASRSDLPEESIYI